MFDKWDVPCYYILVPDGTESGVFIMSKKVRRDVIIKLFNGLVEARVFAVEHKASYPKSYKYRTNRCDHYVYHDIETDTYYFNSIDYDGTRRHTTQQFRELLNII